MYIAPVIDFNYYKRRKMKKYFVVGLSIGLGIGVMVGIMGERISNIKDVDARLAKMT